MKFTTTLASVIALATIPTQASEFFDHGSDDLFGNFGMLKYYRPSEMPTLSGTKDPSKPSFKSSAQKTTPLSKRGFTKTSDTTIAPLDL